MTDPHLYTWMLYYKALLSLILMFDSHCLLWRLHFPFPEYFRERTDLWPMSRRPGGKVTACGFWRTGRGHQAGIGCRQKKGSHSRLFLTNTWDQIIWSACGQILVGCKLLNWVLCDQPPVDPSFDYPEGICFLRIKFLPVERWPDWEHAIINTSAVLIASESWKVFRSPEGCSRFDSRVSPDVTLDAESDWRVNGPQGEGKLSPIFQCLEHYFKVIECWS